MTSIDKITEELVVYKKKSVLSIKFALLYLSVGGRG